ncbi:MAG: hypothetical protein HQL91_08015 [Magnetococcales bacterium]|nr:hypothetical protein [Magnetococcales bacterium]
MQLRTVATHPVRFSFFRSDLETPKDYNLYFLLGEYDYLRLEEVLESSAPDGLAEASVLTSYCAPSDGSDGAVQLSEWLEGRVISGALIRLDFGVRQQLGMNRRWVADLYDVALKIYTIIDTKSCSVMISAGSYSLYILVNLELVELDDAIKKLVCLDLGSDLLIARTTTMPFVALNSLTMGNPIDHNKNKLNAEIYILCALYDQLALINHIKNIFSEGEYELQEIFGDYDVKINIKSKLPLIKLAVVVQQIRKFGRVRTLTRIATTIAVYLSNSNPEFELIDLPDEPVSTRNRELLSKFKWISHRIQASFSDKIAELGQADLLDTLRLIAKELNRGSDYLSDELANALLDALIEGFMQRNGHRSLPSRDFDLARTDLAFGAFIPLKAIHAFLTIQYRYIASQFKEDSKKKLGLDQDWRGLVVASKSHGFEVFPFSVYLVPYDALLSPCDCNSTWQTLSHELCHVVSSEFLQRPVLKKALVDHVIQIKTTNPSFKIPFEVMKLTLEGDLAEISAHYLDFRFFYQGDFDCYLTAIWSTWPQFVSESQSNDVKQSKYRHYLLRSFAVFIMSLDDKLASLRSLKFSNLDWIPQSREILKSSMREFRFRMSLLVRNDEIDPLLAQDGSDALVLSVARIYPLIILFKQQVDESVNSTIPGDQNLSCSKAPNEVQKAIEDGNIVLQCIAPCEFLVRDYHLMLLQRNSKISVKQQLALMLTFAGGAHDPLG